MLQVDRKRPIFFLYFQLFCLLTGSHSYSQNHSPWPVLEASYYNHFYQEDAYFANTCIENVAMDRQGRMWLGVCGSHATINSIGLLTFDGYRFVPYDLEEQSDDLQGQSVRLAGVSSDGRLFGTIGNASCLFFFDPDHRETQLIGLNQFKDHKITSMIEAAPGQFSLVYGPNEIDSVGLLSLKNDRLTLQWSEKYDRRWRVTSFGTPLLESAEEIWFMGHWLPVYRFDKASGRVSSYGKESFEEKIDEIPWHPRLRTLTPSMARNAKGELFIHLPEFYGDRLFKFDEKNKRFKPAVNEFPNDWQPKGIFSDLAGNICFLFLESDQTYRAVLQDTLGVFFDFSAMLKDQSQISKLISRDFFQQVFIMSAKGISSVGVRQSDAIRQALPDTWISSMIQLQDGDLLLNAGPEDWYVFDPKTGDKSVFERPECADSIAFRPGLRQKIERDEAGNFWFLFRGYLVRYNPLRHSCELFFVGTAYQLFLFLDQDLIALAGNNSHLGFYRLSTQSFQDFGDGIPKKLQAKIRDLHFDRHGILWIPSNYGLWRLDLKRKTAKVLGLDGSFGGTRFTSIYESPTGKLWLGVYFGGLCIYDPLTGSKQIIDQQEGLSSNAVMGIISDEDEYVWISTENGITLLTPSGTVIREIHIEDGLNAEVFERFDPYRDREGSLYFASREGLNIIDPKKFKADLNRVSETNIYLTELTYYDVKLNQERSLTSPLSNTQSITLSADRRYLRLKFALNSYIEPQRNRYAFKLDGVDKDWSFLGTQPTLSLNQLPAGKYRLLIKGADYRNNWTEEPLVIGVHAREFFYKQTWFYILLFSGFLGIAFFWIRRLRRERARLEKEVSRRTRQIRADKEIIEQQAKDLQRLDELKSRFFANISHELRTPLTLITGPLQNLLDQEAGNSKRKTYLEFMQKNGAKLLARINELLDLSKLDARKTPIKETSVQISEWLGMLLAGYGPAAEFRDVELSLDDQLPAGLKALLDWEKVEKVLGNYLGNAIKYTGKQGKIGLSVREREGWLEWAVSDTGPGIERDELPHVFDRFYQAGNAKNKGGFGVGLALCKELAELMGGAVDVESQPGRGSVFYLRLPLKNVRGRPEGEVLHSGSSTAAPDYSLPQASSDGQSGVEEASTILLVEDNADLRAYISDLLSDYRIEEAEDGAEALTILQSAVGRPADLPSLIISDIMMPNMDGYALLEHLKSESILQKIPVVMLTARAAEEAKLKALRLGVDDYLTKPFSPQELQLRVKNLLNNARQREQYIRENGRAAEFQFEATASADQVWLEELENAAKEALRKKLDLTRPYLADQMALSERQLLRRLKCLTGLTVQQYVLELKLQKARHLLESETYQTVAEVAYASGFNSPNYFSQLFEKQYGKRPSEY